MKRSEKFILSVSLALASCSTSDSEVVNAARAMGLRDVRPGEVAMFVCGKDDHMGRQFTAVNAKGERVSGVVCCGTFKGCTVRF